MPDRGQPARVTVACLLSLFLGHGSPPLVAGQASPPVGAATGKLELQSEPVGATVYVDGKFSGHTPLVLELPAGERRVKLAKIGYLEKSRLVRLRAGETLSLSLPLTERSLSASQATRGRSKRQLALLGLGAAAVGGGAYLLSSRNNPPVAGVIIANPYTALAAVMNVTFRADDASDRDHDPLTYQWGFGDGASAEGRAVNHIYVAPGRYEVTLTVSDGGASSSSPPVTIVVRSLDGTWLASHQGATLSWTLQQSGSLVSGSYVDSSLSPSLGVGSVAGVVAPPNALRVTAGIPGAAPLSYEGYLDPTLDRMVGRATGAGFPNASLTFARQ